MGTQIKLVFSPDDLHKALGLPDDVEVVGFVSAQDPDYLSVLINGGERHEHTYSVKNSERPTVSLGWLDFPNNPTKSVSSG